MIRFPAPATVAALLALAQLVLTMPASAQQPPALSLEQRMLLRCSAAFAMGAQRQASGTGAQADWPPLAEAGQAFFLRATARVMDEAGLDRAALAAAVAAEAQQIAASATLPQVLAACLPLLPAD